MRKVSVSATLPHYMDHALPVFEALPTERRGGLTLHRGEVALVAGWKDVVPLRGRTPYFYIEHGAGQTYQGDDRVAHMPGYSASGGTQHRGCLGFICPNEDVARRWTTAPTVVVGSPKLGAIKRFEPWRDSTVAITWHWEAMAACPEMGSARAHYWNRLPEVFESWHRQNFHVVAHVHPHRARSEMLAMLAMGADEAIPTGNRVLAECGVLVADNTSLAYEAAALGARVVSLNAPWYRRDVHHGLRFWDNVPGVQLDGPDELIALDLNSVQPDPASGRAALGIPGPSAAHRAARFIVEQLERRGM